MQSIASHKLKIYNSLSGKKESFSPISKDYVGMYVCGPTVYSNVHLGNLRTFTSFDIIFRYLSHIGYKVRYVRNITDVGHLENDEDHGEDRISKKARIENLEPMEVVQKYTYDFHGTTRKFNLLPPSIEPTATGHIIEQIKLIEKLIKKDIAYEVNGYFGIKNMIGNKSSLMNTLKGIGSFLGLFVVCFLIASGEETLMREGKILSATSSKFIGAALFMFYSLILIASGTMLFFGFKNRK